MKITNSIINLNYRIENSINMRAEMMKRLRCDNEKLIKLVKSSTSSFLGWSYDLRVAAYKRHMIARF